MAKSTSTQLKQLIKQYRTAAGLSQEALAERTGISTRTISDMERGLRQAPHLETMRLLADGLEIADQQRTDLFAASRPQDSSEVNKSGMSPPETRNPKTILPAWETPLIGREDELAKISELILHQDSRVVTLTGPGGVGKTRLALQIAHALEDDFPDGVTFVTLTSIANSSLVIPTVARSVGVLDFGSTAIMEAIIAILHRRRMLVVIDNFEHVIETAPFITEIVRNAPDIHFLVTSRARLKLSGESTYPVPPLDLPENIDSFAAVSESEAVRLFVTRARAVEPTFELAQSNASTIAAICRQIDGLPLAIELAAAQTRLLPPEILLPKLADRLSVLTGGPRDAPDRLRTMRDAIAWSYDLLSPDAQATFRRLSVFAGGASLAAIESMFFHVDGPESDVISVVSLLLDQGLIHRSEASEDDVCFSMFETVREFGIEQLVEAGEETTTRNTHATYFLALCEMADVGISGPDQIKWFDRVERELPNIREAMDWLQRSAQPDQGLLLATTLGWFWNRRRYVREGYQWIKIFLEQSTESDRTLRIRALVAMGALALWLGEAQDATELQEQALSLARKTDDRRVLALALRGRGLAATHFGDLERAERLLGASLAMFRERGETWDAAMALNLFAATAYRRQDYPEAAKRYAESESLFLKGGDTLSAAWARGSGALVSLLMGRIEQSREAYVETLAASRANGDDWLASWCLMGIAFFANEAGDHERAARLFGAASMMRDAAGVSVPPGMRPIYDRQISKNRAALETSIWERAYDLGRSLSLEAAVVEAEAVVSRSHAS